MIGVPGALQPQEEVDESELGNDKEKFHNIPVDIVDENKTMGMNQRIIRSRRLPYFTSRRGARKKYK